MLIVVARRDSENIVGVRRVLSNVTISNYLGGCESHAYSLRSDGGKGAPLIQRISNDREGKLAA